MPINGRVNFDTSERKCGAEITHSWQLLKDYAIRSNKPFPKTIEQWTIS